MCAQPTQHEDGFRGRTGGKIERAKRIGSSRRGGSGGQGGRGRSRGQGKARGDLGPYAQRAVVKTHYVKMTSAQGKARARAHLSYLTREGVSADGERGELYGAEGATQARDFLERSEGDPHQFRVILSPEMAHELDLTEYTQAWMKHLERDLGTKLDWVAVNHYNTDNYHTHVLIRGVDARGEELRIDREYLSHGMRNRAEQVATNELGPRTLDQVREARLREVEQLRYTSLDRTLERRTNDQGEVDLRHAPQRKEADPSLRCDLLARARFLCEQDRAQEVRPCVFVMQDKLKEELTALGKKHDIIAHLHQAGAKQPTDWCLDPPRAGEVIEAKVLDRGLADELKGREYLVLQDTEQRVRHIELGRHWEADRAKVGEWVKIEVSTPRTPAEQEAAHTAQSTPRDTKKDAELVSGPQQERQGQASGETSLAQREGAPHLRVERLGRLDEMVEARKMTWLDERIAAGASPAKHPEVEAAQRTRAEVLERWELKAKEAPPDPAVLSKELAKIELQAIKDKLIERFPDKPILSATVLHKNEGVLREEIVHKNGRFVVLETDKHQILYRSTPELRAQLGQRVEITRGERGYVAAPADKQRGMEL